MGTASDAEGRRRRASNDAVRHPSGLTLERWNWPFKTPEERKKVAAWFAVQRREEIINGAEAPF